MQTWVPAEGDAESRNDGFVANFLLYASAATTITALAGTFRVSFPLAALALYGAGNIYWTVVIRTQDPEPFPSFADALWLSFYPCAFVALLLIVREIAEDVPLSLWLDGVVGGMAVAGVAAAFFGPILAVVVIVSIALRMATRTSWN